MKRIGVMLLCACGNLEAPSQAASALDGIDCSDPNLVTRHSLIIRQLSVVEDPQRTGGSGVWSFNELVSNLAGAGDPALLVERWMMELWEVDSYFNDVAVGRPIKERVLDHWPRTLDGRLDL